MHDSLVVLHIVENLDDSYGGPARSIPELALALENFGVESHILSVSTTKDSYNSLVDEYKLSHHQSNIVISKRFYFSLSFPVMLVILIRKYKVSVVHFHSVWTFPTVIGYHLTKIMGVPMCVSARSNFYADSLKKNRFLKSFVQKIAVNDLLRATLFVHSTAEKESYDLRTFGYSGKIIQSPNGINIEEFNIRRDPTLAGRDLRRSFIYLGRISPRKQIEIALSAFAEIKDQFSCWDFYIVGPVEDKVYQKLLIKQVEELGLSNRVVFRSMVKGNERINALLNSDVFVNSSKFENFGMSIGEAMAAGIPVIVSRNTPWEQVVENNAGWWVDSTIEAFRFAMSQAASLSDSERTRMGQAGRCLIENNYSWQAQANSIATSYKEALGDGFKT